MLRPLQLLFLGTLLALCFLSVQGQSDAQQKIADSLHKLGELYHKKGEYEKALPMYQQARSIREKELGKEHPDYARSLNNLGALYYQIGQYGKALLLYEQALGIREKTLGKEHPDYASSLNNLADLFRRMKQYEKALPLYQQALNIREKALGREHPDYANSLKTLALLYVGKGQYEKALPLYQQAQSITEKALGKEHPDYASNLNDLAELFRRMGQFEKALPLFQQVLGIREKTLGTEHAKYASSLKNLALLYAGIGEYEKALSLYQQAQSITGKSLGKEHPKYASTLNDLADLFKRMGQYEKALPMYQQALGIRVKTLGQEHPDYAQSLKNLALFYRDIGQYKKALPLFQQAQSIRERTLGKQHPDYANSLNNLADLFRKMKQYEKALPLYQQALNIREKALGREHPDYANSLKTLALLYVGKGQYEKALPLYWQAQSITEKALGKEHPKYASNLNDLANLFRRMGQYEKALSLVQQALNIREKTLGREHPDYAASLKNLALLNFSLNNHKKAQVLAIQAMHINLNHIAATYTTLSEQEKMILMNASQDMFHILPSMIFTSGNAPSSTLQQLYDSQLLLKGMVLQDQQNVLHSIRQSGDSTALALYEQWAFQKKFLGRQLLLPIAQQLPYLDSLQEVTNRLEQELSRRSTSFRSHHKQQRLSARDIAGKLSPTEAAVEFISFLIYRKTKLQYPDSVMYAALLLLPADTTVRFVPLFEEKQLQRLLCPDFSAPPDVVLQQLYRSPGLEIGNQEQGGGSDSLYRLIWKPLERHLQGITTVYYAPTGLLHRVAFVAIRADSTHLVMDKFKLCQMLSTRSIALPQKIGRRPATAGIWGNIHYDLPSSAAPEGSTATRDMAREPAVAISDFYTAGTRNSRGRDWRPLPGTLQELDSLKGVLRSYGINVTTYSGSQGSEDGFKALDGKSPQLLHLATHGFFLPLGENKLTGAKLMSEEDNLFTVQQNPMFRSGLVLAGANQAWKGEALRSGQEDGILTAYEIGQMNLSSTDLVVLSACETALGDVQGAEGVIGLQRAFKMAGVKQMLMSLWRVPDRETAELMTGLYRHWLGGQTPREALRLAQLQLKEKYPPYYWAAFVLVE